MSSNTSFIRTKSFNEQDDKQPKNASTGIDLEKANIIESRKSNSSERDQGRVVEGCASLSIK